MDLLLDVNTHDVVFINGETPVTREYTESVAQRLKVRLLTFLGEWFLDSEIGVPYLQQILGSRLEKSQVDLILQSEILKDEDVEVIKQWESERNPSTREYSCKFSCITRLGTTTEILTLDIGV